MGDRQYLLCCTRAAQSQQELGCSVFRPDVVASVVKVEPSGQSPYVEVLTNFIEAFCLRTEEREDLDISRTGSVRVPPRYLVCEEALLIGDLAHLDESARLDCVVVRPKGRRDWGSA